MSKDIVVDRAEWETIMLSLQEFDQNFKDNLSEYLSVIEKLTSEGFIEGNAHDNLVVFKDIVSNIKETADELYGRINPIVTSFLEDVENDDVFLEGAIELVEV